MNQDSIRPDLRVADFDYDLPQELIAQTPLPDRDRSRLLVLDHASGGVSHAEIRHLGDWLNPGDLLVANNSRVLPARLRARKAESGGQVELLLLRQVSAGRWSALAKPARRLRPGTRLLVTPRPGVAVAEAEVVVAAIGDEGEVEVDLGGLSVARLDDYGEAPLPPYIHTRLDDPERYQTVYASVRGSAAAPTAGLHFTPPLRDDLAQRGVGWAEVTLHVGLDTFRPVTVERVRDHHIHQEWCAVSDETASAIAATKAAGRRVVAIGTTAARTLETLGQTWDPARPQGFAGMTHLFIVPGYQWTVVDALLTNFHLPRSTLLMMISAFAGWEPVRSAYQEAIAQRYRFFSFGDAMLIR